MKSKKFQRKIEDFVCGYCGKKNKGDGYTNHCPYCLWSKHVDINPGDRQETCQGLMKPISVNYKSGRYIIQQRCNNCHIIRNIKSSKFDDKEEIIKLASSNNL